MPLPHHHLRETCRLCDASSPTRVLALTPTPPANAYVAEGDLGEPQVEYPLDVYRCGECGHVQLLDIVDPAEMFSHYAYVSSTSPVMVDFLAGQATGIQERLALAADDLVVEFGSNDGTLLRAFQGRGMRVLGVDPAANVVPDPDEIPNVVDFFGAEVARKIRAEHGPARAICAYNVCAHIDDLAGVADGVRELLAPDGEFVMQVGYLLDVYQKTLFDTIYHEHVDFHRVGPLRRFFSSRGLELRHVERAPIQGGALIAHVGHPGGVIDPSVPSLIAEEEAAGLHELETFQGWARRIEARKVELTGLLRGLKAQGKTIAGYGAPAKATTLMYHFGLDRELVEFLVDENPRKQGTYTPGLHVPILSPTELTARRPDYVVVLAWNFAESIIAKYRGYAGDAGRFVVPLPDLRVV